MSTNDEGSVEARPNRLIFGSCNSQSQGQPLWQAIGARNASAFIWAGDSVYSDRKIRKTATPASLFDLAESYNKQMQNPDYQEFLKHQRTIVGTYDDHDYGVNNGDREYELKKESALHFVEFLEKSAQRPWELLSMRAREEKGVYGVFVFDFARVSPLVPDYEAGIDVDAVPPPDRYNNTQFGLSEKSVAVFLLDVRYNKTPWTKQRYKDYAGDYKGDFLGEDQWQWFEQSLARSTASVNIVVTGLQVHPDRWFDGNLVEDWSRYPLAQHRLYQNLLRPNVKAPILVSGDVHMAEYLRRDCKRPKDVDGPSRSIVEVTTSGMTHSWGTFNCPLRGKTYACSSSYLQRMIAFSMHLGHINGSWRNLIDYKGPRQENSKRRTQYSLDLNFGEFEFDWEMEQVKVRILGKDPEAPPLLSAKWDFANLSSSFDLTGKLQKSDFIHRYETMSKQSHIPQEEDWICLPNQGTMSPMIKIVGPISALFISGVVFLAPLWVPIVLILYFFRLRKVKIE